MNSRATELALKKQRLQFAGATLRGEFARHARGLEPIFSVADRAVDGVRWVYRHPQILVAVGVALVVARPRRAWRWTRRTFIGWQAWRRLRRLLEERFPA